MMGVAALLAEPRIAPASLGYLIVAFCAARFIDHRFMALSARQLRARAQRGRRGTT